MTAHAQVAQPAVRALEQALADLAASQPQTAIAQALGLACHSQISRRMGRVLSGDAGWLEVFSASDLVALAQTYPAVAGALATVARRGDSAPIDVVAALAEAMGSAGRLIEDAAAALSPDGIAGPRISADERRKLVIDVTAIELRLRRLRLALAKGD